MSSEAATDTGTPPSDAPGHGLTFRPDIQGIRALAVLLVIANHLAPGTLTGGFVGVDVFFVVSGYLITSLLLGDVVRRGRISLADFYARRARRIVPAATVVTLATVAVSLVTLPLLRVRTILTDAVWVTFFGANIRMADVGTDYFAIGQPPSPLRHYWSLSVEEQFYLVWPALLLGVLLLVRWRRRGSARTFRRDAGVLTVALCVLSLAWSVWATYDSPVTAYFSTLTRAWELGAGAALALLIRREALPAAARQVLALAGIGAIAVAALFFSATTSFPSGWALVPVLGTVALIAAGGGGGTTVVGRVLSLRPAVAVGDWSYSLYLWHWPIIVLLRSHLGVESFDRPAVRGGTLVFVFVLSWASYRWIETPFRHGTWKRRGRALLIYPVAIAMVLVTVVGSTQYVRYQLGEFSHEPPISTAEYGGTEKLGPDPYVALVRASVLAAKQGRAVPGDLTPGLFDLRAQTASLGACDYRTGTRELCPIGDPDADRSIVVLGDSHARALSPGIDEIGKKYGFKVYVLVYSGCSATDLVQIDRATGRRWDPCEDFKAWAKQTIASIHPDLVVVSTSANWYEDPTADAGSGAVVGNRSDFDHYLAVLQQGWEELFDDLEADTGRVFVVGNTPKLPRETGVCLSQGHPDLGDCAFPPGPYAHREAEASFRAARAAGAGVVDAGPWFCAQDLCPSVVGKYITLRDSEHVTPDYARWLATPLAAALGVTR
ncbi:acyltransferase family protein [Nocardioides mangrovi]|uniref:Acyltransferase n=1 Tax=Nocardioides mangrovi TaxID=2874580 RepID=A0ABS7U8X2_9ACTN|nr:acyltransferase family protein [Nocardioides mangrovi]MBZ5737300.1 acyltransferase [Nocardioides mangrovi]